MCLRDGPVLVAPLELVLVWGFYSSIRCQSKIPFFIKIDVCALNVEGKQVPREQSVLGRQRFCGCFWGIFTEYRLYNIFLEYEIQCRKIAA